MFLKKISKVLALALVLISMGTPLANANSPVLDESQKSVYANETLGINRESQKSVDEFVIKKINEGIKFEENKNLSQDEIDSRFEKISTDYDMYEPFSAIDEEFVLFYAQNPAKPEQNIDPIESRYVKPGVPTGFSRSRTLYGITGRFEGVVNLIGVSSLHNYKFTMKGSMTAYESHIGSKQAKLRCEAFGILGSGGVGRVYNKTIYTSKRTKPGATNFDIFETTGLILGFVGAELTPNATFTTKNGSTFTL